MRMGSKENAKSFPTHKLFPCYRKSGSSMRMRGSEFWSGAQFSKNR